MVNYRGGIELETALSYFGVIAAGEIVFNILATPAMRAMECLVTCGATPFVILALIAIGTGPVWAHRSPPKDYSNPE